MNKKFNPSLRSLFEYKTLRFIGKNPEGKEWGDKGSKRSPYLHQQVANPRLASRMWPNGHILATDPRPKPQIRGLLAEIRGAFAPLISSFLSSLGFYL